jgi:glycolate oxidase
VGGTITGEHGVGAEKPGFMQLIYSPDDLDAQRKAKEVFDPAGIANPGKVLPEPDGGAAPASGLGR